MGDPQALRRADPAPGAGRRSAEHGAHAVATVRREWLWREDGDGRRTSRIFYVATMRDGLICRWAPFTDLDDALQAAGVD